EAGPAGAAFELGPAAEERKAALPAAEHPRPRLAEQRPAEGRLGAVREQHPLLLGRQVGFQPPPLLFGGRGQIVAGGGAKGVGHPVDMGASASFARGRLTIRAWTCSRCVSTNTIMNSSIDSLCATYQGRSTPSSKSSQTQTRSQSRSASAITAAVARRGSGQITSAPGRGGCSRPVRR